MLNIYEDKALEHATLIQIISASGDEYGSALLSFMDEYGIIALKDARIEQLKEYAERRGLLRAAENASVDAAASCEGMRFMGRDLEERIYNEERG